MSPLHILYIVQYFNLPHEPGGGRAYHFARRWADMGHQVTVVTGTVNHKTSSVADRYRGRLFTPEEVEGVRLIRCASTTVLRGSFVGRLVNFATFALLSTYAAARKTGRPDVVYASSTPLTIGLPGYVASRRWRVPFVFEVRDLWPESAKVAGVLRNRAALALARFFEKFLYRSAKRIVAVTEGIRQGVIDAGKNPEAVTFVPNGVDDIFDEDRREPSHSRLVSGSRFVCMYMGALGMWNGNRTILEAARLLRDREEIEFIFVGDGNERTELERYARDNALSAVRFVGVLPKNEAVHELQHADVCLICTWDHPFHRMVLANKIFDYLAAGRPVIVAAAGEMATLVEKASAGIAVPPGQPEALAEAIIWMLELPEEKRRAMGKSGRAYVLSNFRRRDLAERAERVLREAVAGSR